MSERDEIRSVQVEELPPADNPAENKAENSTELGEILSSISQLMVDSERRQSAALNEMQARISQLASDAEAVRDEVPAEHQGAFQRVEDAVEDLASRFDDDADQDVKIAEVPPLSDGASAALDQLASGAEDDDQAVLDSADDPAVATLSDPGEPQGEEVRNEEPRIEEPWDEASAEQLMQLYESGDAGLPASGDLMLGVHEDAATPPAAAQAEVREAPETAAEDPAVVAPVDIAPVDVASVDVAPVETAPMVVGPAENDALDKAWLEEHFARIAERIEVSLEKTSTQDASIEVMERRFDDLEGQFHAALEQVATRADIAGLSEIEACIVEFTAQFDRSQAELARIESVESQVRELAERLSEERLEAMAQPAGDAQQGLNAEHIAEFVARHVAERSASKVAEIMPQSDDEARQEIGEVKGLLNNLIAEHRNEGKQTSERLDTMQEAMVRLLDRIESMEGPHEAGRPAEEMATEKQPVGQEPDLTAAAVETAAERPQATDAEISPVLRHDPADRTAFDGGADDAGARDGDEAPEEKGGSDLARPGLDRQTFIAEARRAAAKANARAANGEQSGEGAGEARGGGVGKAMGKTLAGIPQTSRVRLAIAAVAVIAIGLGAANLVFGLAGGRTAPEVTAPANKAAGQDAPKPSSGASRVKPGANGEAAKEPQQRRATAMGENGSLPPGIAIYNPAALVPSASGPASQATSGSRTSLNKNLPPALIGPLSLRLAAANGNPSAAFEVGARFAEGKGVRQNFKEAAGWYTKSATQGFALAQYRLATLHERGLGMDEDLARAKIWYQRAARQGNVKSMHNLAVLTAGGKAGRSDYGSAARWFTAAAERGLADSQFNLAILYENGLGVSKDLKQAYRWFSLAARAGDKAADARRQKLAKELDASDVARLDGEAQKWRRRSISRLANDSVYAGRQWKKQTSAAAKQG